MRRDVGPILEQGATEPLLRASGLGPVGPGPPVLDVAEDVAEDLAEDLAE